MRINRLELIKQLNARIDALTQAAEDKYQQAIQAEHDREEAYFDKTGEAWRDFAGNILGALNAGRGVVAADVPEGLRGWGHGSGPELFQPKVAKRERPAIGELARLIKLLEACPDETVSLASLERAGFVLGRVLK